MPDELLFRPADGSPFNVEYFGNMEASAKKCKGGWLRMGDGEFIDPAPIEKVIAESGAVADVYVCGVKAASGAPGEEGVVAAVVPETPNDFDPQIVFRARRAKLEVSSVISRLQVVLEIPKTASKKPLERYLVEMFEGQSGSAFTERS